MTRRVPPPTPGNRALDGRVGAKMEAEARASLGRSCPAIGGRVGLRYRLEGREVVSFCSNDYLGLADIVAVAEDQPSGAGASRLVCGELEAHRELEARFAAFMGFEDAILFPSGFQANVGVPSALIAAEDEVHSDALNHASLIDGLRLAPVRPRILAHGSAPERGADAAGLAWWITESVFSMDGDGPRLGELDTWLASGGCLYLDEAHALGLYAGGRGRAAALRHRPTVVVAPLGKAFGCAGAFVCASSSVCAWLRGHARAFVFSTGVSPVLVARIAHALELVASAEGERRREALWRRVELLRGLLDLPGGQATPIVPLVVGSNSRALDLSRALFERGWHVQAIRPPTVPAGEARLRITLSAAHELEQIERFAADLLELRP